MTHSLLQAISGYHSELFKYVESDTDDNFALLESLIIKSKNQNWQNSAYIKITEKPMLLQHYAAKCGNKRVLELLLANDAIVDAVAITDIYYAPDFLEEDTPLSLAVKNGQYECAQLLLEYNANPNLHLNKYFTIISYSIKRNDVKMLQLLIKFGADIQKSTYIRSILSMFNIYSRQFTPNNSPLHQAISINNLDIAIELIAAGAIIHKYYIYAASSKEMLELLLSKGLDIEYRVSSPCSTRAMYMSYPTPLISAVEEKSLPKISALLSLGADVNGLYYYETISGNKELVTPIYLAIIARDMDIVSLLLANGASVNHKISGCYYLETALHNNCDMHILYSLMDKILQKRQFADGSIPSVDLELGPDVKSELLTILSQHKISGLSLDKETNLLHFCIEKNYFDISRHTIRLLIEFCADINSLNANGESALYALMYAHAVNSNNAQIKTITDFASELILFGADVNLPNPAGVTPLQSSLTLHDRFASIFLITHGANINAYAEKFSTEIKEVVDVFFTEAKDNLTSDDQIKFIVAIINSGFDVLASGPGRNFLQHVIRMDDEQNNIRKNIQAQINESKYAVHFLPPQNLASAPVIETIDNSDSEPGKKLNAKTVSRRRISNIFGR